ncbi:hypothetical protein [Alteraurantiacibacter aquimixticola]|uniref:Type IV pilus biogenesis protein PilP n=1 Tax=Alteraurantiacibacter aquimixticola TaxID=2489173 RepID=A0A4T3EZX9_9SPHN|nr:hypothetical protein [Alteraurantiacibacter aquimixticola]TIX49714.1 hypothetical protein E5222_12940 [Alteraurantiacibacter aquimixticola]
MANHRLKWLVALPAALVATTPAAAQEEDYERIVTIMRACAEIEDVMARVTCYDNNIGAGRPSAAPSASSGTSSVPAVNAPAGFGAEMVRQPEVRRSQEQEDAITARVSSVSEVEPDIYLITLSDGAQWRFVDSAPFGFSPPRAGDTVELERGSLGSVFLEYDGQRRIRVRRLR